MVGTVVLVGADSTDRSVTEAWELCCHSAKAADPPMASRTVMQTTMRSMRPGDGRAPLSMLFPLPLIQPGTPRSAFPYFVGTRSRVALSPLKIGSIFGYMALWKFHGSYC